MVPLISNPTQLPAHNFVPLTVPTSLQPIGSFGVTWKSGLLPTLGGSLWASAVAEKQMATRTNTDFIVIRVLALTINAAISQRSAIAGPRNLGSSCRRYLPRDISVLPLSEQSRSDSFLYQSQGLL